MLYQIRGELERAEEMYQKSLAINEALGRKEAWPVTMATSETYIRSGVSLRRLKRCTRS
ncbi:MAG: hypothetical protein H6992_12245 [Pseudomonadales bacterium]|nr:hypothetical protein [Pseudomonadales bacterium]